MQLDADATLHHLNQVVRWYRNSTTGSPSVGLPSDTMYQDNTQNLGQQAVRLAFQSAKAEAALIGAQPKSAGSAAGAQQTSQAQTLAQLEAKDSAQISDLQTQIDNLNSQIAKASGTHRSNLLSQRGALESELELQKARLEAIQKMASFVESNGEISGGLEGEINQLARSIPEVTGSAAAGTKTATAPVTAKPSLANSGGLISEAITLYDHVRAAR
jgi:TolA-binding protein